MRSRARSRRGAPLYDFAAPDGVRHTVWRCTGADQATRARGRVRRHPGALHRRWPSPRRERGARARRAARRRGDTPTPRPTRSSRWRFPTTRCRSCPYNRDREGSGGAHAGAVSRRAARARAGQRRRPRRRERQGEVSMYLAGRWYTLASDAARRPATTRAPSSLDVARAAARACSSRCCKIGDVRTDKRIDFVGGARGTAALERAVDCGQRGGGVLDVSRDDRRSHGDFRRRRHHAAEIHLVRTEAARRAC